MTLAIGEVSPDPHAKARKMQSSILQRLAPQGIQSRIATLVGVDDSTVTRWKSDLDRTCLILTSLGLKIVSEEKVCVPADEIAFLRKAYHAVCEQAPWLLNEGEGE